jgi:anti-sigma B factor antagonist
MDAGAACSSSPPPTVLVLSGDLDVVAAPQLRQALAEAVLPGSRVVVDATDVEFVDSVGMGVLAAAHRRALAGGGTLVVRAPQERVLRVLRIVGLAGLLEDQAPAR